MPDRILDLTVHAIGAQGDGVAAGPDGPVYVDGAAPGDRITGRLVRDRKTRKTVFQLDRIYPASEQRQAPPCPYFDRCGGCTLQHITPDAYQKWMIDKVHNTFAHQGFQGLEVRAPLISPPASRRRLTLRVRRTGQGVAMGFLARRSRDLVDVQSCLVSHPALVSLFEPLRQSLGQVLDTGGALKAQMTMTDSGVDLVLHAQADLSLAGREMLAELAQAHDLASITWNDRGFAEPVAVSRPPVMRFGPLSVPLPPGAFLQATAEGEASLSQIVTAACDGVRTVADLFCGLGTLSLPLLPNGLSIRAVEGDSAAVSALQGALATAGLGHQMTVDHRDLFRRPLLPDELQGLDAVIIDPPRAGAADQMRQLAASAVPRVIGVSCNPSTFARDARLLVDGGYQLKWLQPVDQFLYSPHLELVGLFERS